MASLVVLGILPIAEREQGAAAASMHEGAVVHRPFTRVECSQGTGMRSAPATEHRCEGDDPKGRANNPLGLPTPLSIYHLNLPVKS